MHGFRNTALLAAALCVTLPTIAWAQAGEHRADSSQAPAPAPAPQALFSTALDTIRQNFNGSVDVAALTTAALKGMAGALDGHSTYMSPEEYRNFQVSAVGEFAGVGAVIETSGGKLRVVAPTDTGPAARAGVGAGWEILTIDNKPADKLSIPEAISRLRGAVGTKVVVGFRDTAGRDHVLELTRETIRLHNVYQRRIGSVGYIHLTGFAQVTDREFGEAQAALLAGGPLTGLVLDLRNNPGGFIDAAVRVASRFLKSGEIVVRTGRTAASSTAIAAIDQGEALRNLPVVVLVNGGSASASEIVAAALQDNRRASVLGLVTFGKGLVQNIFPLDGGASGALSVTTMRYYTPSGRSIQRIGVTPDVLVARTAREAREATKATPGFTEAAVFNAPDNEMKLERFVPDAVEGPASPIAPSDPPLFAHPLPTDAELATDFQVTRAIEILQAGGIAAARALHPARIYRRAPQQPPSAAGAPQGGTRRGVGHRPARRPAVRRR